MKRYSPGHTHTSITFGKPHISLAYGRLPAQFVQWIVSMFFSKQCIERVLCACYMPVFISFPQTNKMRLVGHHLLLESRLIRTQATFLVKTTIRIKNYARSHVCHVVSFHTLRFIGGCFFYITSIICLFILNRVREMEKRKHCITKSGAQNILRCVRLP